MKHKVQEEKAVLGWQMQTIRCMQSKNAEGIIVVLTCIHLMGKLVFLTDGVNVNWMSMI